MACSGFAVTDWVVGWVNRVTDWMGDWMAIIPSTKQHINLPEFHTVFSFVTLSPGQLHIPPHHHCFRLIPVPNLLGLRHGNL